MEILLSGWTLERPLFALRAGIWRREKRFPVIDLLRPVILIVLVLVLIQLLILIFLILILVLKLKSLTYCKVTDCYSQAYDSTPFTERHPDLLTKYKFDCKCRSLKMRMRIISMLMMMMTMVIEWWWSLDDISEMYDAGLVLVSGRRFTSCRGLSTTCQRTRWWLSRIFNSKNHPDYHDHENLN